MSVRRARLSPLLVGLIFVAGCGPTPEGGLRLLNGLLAAAALGLLAAAWGSVGPVERRLRRHPRLLRWLFWVPVGLVTLLVVAGIPAAFAGLGALGSGVSGDYDPALWWAGFGVSAVLNLGLVLVPVAWNDPGRWVWLAILALLVGVLTYGALAFSAFNDPAFQLYFMEMVSPLEGSPGLFGSSEVLAHEMKKTMIFGAAIGTATAGLGFLNALGILLVLRSGRRSSGPGV